jgi:hypothetical protein
VLLIGTVGWALSGLRRGREATRLTAAGYTSALQEAAAADAAAAVTSSKAMTAPALVAVHASSAGTLTAGSIQQQQQQQGSGLKHRASCKPSDSGTAGGAASPVISKQQQQHAATTHSIYKSRPPGSQVGVSPANSSLHVCSPCLLCKRSSSLSTYCMQRRRPGGSHVGVLYDNRCKPLLCASAVALAFPYAAQSSWLTGGCVICKRFVYVC